MKLKCILCDKNSPIPGSYYCIHCRQPLDLSEEKLGELIEGSRFQMRCKYTLEKIKGETVIRRKLPPCIAWMAEA